MESSDHFTISNHVQAQQPILILLGPLGTHNVSCPRKYVSAAFGARLKESESEGYAEISHSLDYIPQPKVSLPTLPSLDNGCLEFCMMIRALTPVGRPVPLNLLNSLFSVAISRSHR